MIRFVSLVLALAATTSASFLPFFYRQVDDLSPVGTFRIRFGTLSTGACPRSISHNVGPDSAQMIPHSEMTMNELECTSDGGMSVLSKDALVNSTSNEDVINTIEDFDSRIPGIIYGLERTGRECEEDERRLSSFSEGTVVMIFKPEETTSVNLVTFKIGRTYMVTYDPELGPCYFLKLKETPTPVPTEPVAPPVTPGTTAPSQTTPSATTTETEPGETEPVEAESSPEMSPEVSPGAEEDDDDDEDDGSVCFPADATVELEDGTIKKMEEISLGDSVKVAEGQFSDIFMFTHKDASRTYSFVKIYTESGAVISATPGHYIYVNGNLAAAKTAIVGDNLELGNGQATTVTAVERVRKVGLYNPQTLHGDIVVNSLRASTFTRTVNPPSAQALMAPLRHIYAMFGLSGSFLDNGADCIAPFVPHGNMVM